MDQTGYDCVWLAEHHFNTYSVCPSINVMASHVAARTRNLRIGMAVSLAAFYNPLRLAEEVALIDVLSGGRVNWGAGRGFDRAEFEAFGVPVEESSDRFRECVEIVLAAWRNERVSATRGGSGPTTASRCCPSHCRRRTRRCGWRPRRRIRSRAPPRRATTSCRTRTPPTPTSAASARTTTRCCARTASPPRAG